MQVPSAVFIQPPLGTVGLTEEQAREAIAGDVDVYISKFRAMKNTITGRDEKTLVKIIVEVATDKVQSHATSTKHTIFEDS
jgi:glutathione reductase (NADPH)